MTGWRRMVLDTEGLHDWTVLEGEPYCYMESKTIKIDTDEDHANFLHEVAHALHPEAEGCHKNHFHGGGWVSQFTRLVNKYMTIQPAAPTGGVL